MEVHITERKLSCDGSLWSLSWVFNTITSNLAVERGEDLAPRNRGGGCRSEYSSHCRWQWPLCLVLHWQAQSQVKHKEAHPQSWVERNGYFVSSCFSSIYNPGLMTIMKLYCIWSFMTGKLWAKSPGWVGFLESVWFSGEFIFKTSDLRTQGFDDWIVLEQGKTKLPVCGRIKLKITHVAPQTRDDMDVLRPRPKVGHLSWILKNRLRSFTMLMESP